jgi:prephenate dehydrogenase
VRWNKVAIIGVGLLGGSLALAIKKRRLARTVVGFVRRAASVAACRRLGIANQVTRDLSLAVRDADLIVLCTPLSQMRPLVEQMIPALKSGVIITDVGSVKASVVTDLEALVAKAGGYFVGSHPMAGAEKIGVAHARADLFQSAVCVVTPTKRSNAAAVRKVERFWKAIGCRVVRLTPEAHDELVSRSSHLPHMLAAALANYVLHPDHPKQQPALCANGFRDTTRIASGSPEMWRDIALANRAQLRRALDDFVRELQSFQALLRRKDDGKIFDLFASAKARRDGWRAGEGSPSSD